MRFGKVDHVAGVQAADAVLQDPRGGQANNGVAVAVGDVDGAAVRRHGDSVWGLHMIRPGCREPGRRLSVLDPMKVVDGDAVMAGVGDQHRVIVQERGVPGGRKLAFSQCPDHLQGRGIENLHHVMARVRDQQVFAVGREHEVVRPVEERA